MLLAGEAVGQTSPGGSTEAHEEAFLLSSLCTWGSSVHTGLRGVSQLLHRWDPWPIPQSQAWAVLALRGSPEACSNLRAAEGSPQPTLPGPQVPEICTVSKSRGSAPQTVLQTAQPLSTSTQG